MPVLRLKNLLLIILPLLIFSVFSSSIHAQAKKEEFNAGDLIIEHVLDDHRWHIAHLGELTIEVPLPIILYYKGGLHAFWSTQFDKQGRKGIFELRTEAPYKGKIVAYAIDDKGLEKIDSSLPLDLSITKNVVSILFCALLVLLAFTYTTKKYKERGIAAPKGFQNLMEMIYLFVRNEIVYANLGRKYGDKFLPYLMSLFFFICCSNLSGLVPVFPFGANIMGNIASALALALLTFILTIRYSTKHYWKHIFNNPDVPWWMKFPIPLMPIIELMEVFSKPFILMIRIFANMTAGHVVMLGFVCIIFIFGSISTSIGLALSPVSIIFGLFVSLLEILVSAVQAYIFTLLTSLYIAAALGYQAGKTEHE